MTAIPLNKTGHAPMPQIFAGIDVGAEELVLVIRKDGKPFDPQTFANTPADRARLVKKLVKLPGAIVCMDDCMDAEGRATQEQLPRPRGPIILIWPSPCMTRGRC
jgi:hypothetical protein